VRKIRNTNIILDLLFQQGIMAGTKICVYMTILEESS